MPEAPLIFDVKTHLRIVYLRVDWPRVREMGGLLAAHPALKRAPGALLHRKNCLEGARLDVRDVLAHDLARRPAAGADRRVWRPITGGADQRIGWIIEGGDVENARLGAHDIGHMRSREGAAAVGAGYG